MPLLSRKRIYHTYYFGKKSHEVGNENLFEVKMREEYDFSKAKKNPYAKALKKQITIRLDTDCISYFKSLSRKTGITYQNLINLYLKDCAASHRTLTFKWR